MGTSWHLQMACIFALVVYIWWVRIYQEYLVGKDVYGQSEDEGCLGMLQGCAGHAVCGGGTMEESTRFFWEDFA